MESLQSYFGMGGLFSLLLMVCFQTPSQNAREATGAEEGVMLIPRGLQWGEVGRSLPGFSGRKLPVVSSFSESPPWWWITWKVAHRLTRCDSGWKMGEGCAGPGEPRWCQEAVRWERAEQGPKEPRWCQECQSWQESQRAGGPLSSLTR